MMKRSRYALTTQRDLEEPVGRFDCNKPEYDVERHQNTNSAAGSEQDCEVKPKQSAEFSVYRESLLRHSRDGDIIRAVNITGSAASLVQN